jgi:multiple antibiotic resistance protein
MLITWVVFLASGSISGFLSEGGLRAISRVFSLLLAAIGVNMIIRGLYLLEILIPKTTP